MRAPIAIGIVFHITQCFAQPARPAFDAASIKPSKADEGSSSWNGRGGYLNMRNQTLRALVSIAYEVREDQISGGPKWLASDRFDIEARAAGLAKDSEVLAMLQTLLAERFQLAIHRDTRPSDGFALVPAKNGGLKIRPDESEGKNGWNSRRGSIDAQRITMAKLADSLSRMLGTPVIDRTDTQGVYSFKLEWNPESMQRSANPDNPPPDAPLGPSLFTVLQEQLGLKLEPRKTPVTIIVIDKAEKLSEN